MSESLEDALESATVEVNDLQEQYDRFLADNKQHEASGVSMTSARQSEGEGLLRGLNESRQRQNPLLLLSILQSSDHLEAATRNLLQSSESQLKFSESQLRVAESHVRVAESQARAIDNLLTSSRRLEQFTIFLLVVGFLNVFIIEYTTGLLNGPLGIGTIAAFVVAILVLSVVAIRWDRTIRRNPNVGFP